MPDARSIDNDGGDGWIALAAEILRSAPRLSDAACRSAPDVFDGESPAARRTAAALCASCADRVACAAWIDRTPMLRRPTGVLAGRLHTRPGDGRKERIVNVVHGREEK